MWVENRERRKTIFKNLNKAGENLQLIDPSGFTVSAKKFFKDYVNFTRHSIQVQLGVLEEIFYRDNAGQR